jgi:uncharacterized membrane protein
MTHVFVWTVGDVFGLAVLALMLALFGALLLMSKVDDWKRARRKRKRQGGPTT